MALLSLSGSLWPGSPWINSLWLCSSWSAFVAGLMAWLPTGQLFLDLCAPGSPQEADSLADPILSASLQLVGGAAEHQVAQSPGCGLLHILVGAAEQVHKLADASQLVDLGTGRHIVKRRCLGSISQAKAFSGQVNIDSCWN